MRLRVRLYREGSGDQTTPDYDCVCIFNYCKYGELLREFFVISESEVSAGRKHRNFQLHINMALYIFCRLCSKSFQENQILRERLQCLYKGTKCLHDVFGIS